MNCINIINTVGTHNRLKERKKGMLVILLDYKDRRPIYEQIVDRYKDMILKGIVEADSQLPSVRNLAMELSINPNTIQRAYAELEHQGFIYSIKGKGSFIAQNESLLEEKRMEIMNSFKGIVKQGKVLKISQEQWIDLVKQEYKEARSHD